MKNTEEADLSSAKADVSEKQHELPSGAYPLFLIIRVAWKTGLE